MKTQLLVKVLILSAALACAYPPPVVAQSDQQFIELDEFFSQNPQELEKLKAFDRRVQEPSERYPGKIGAPVRISVIYPGLQVSDYWRRSVASFTARMDEIGIPHAINSLFTKGDGDLLLQQRALGDVLRDKPDYLVFTLDALRHKGMISRVLSAGNTRIILQNITTPLPDLSRPAPFLYVGFDHGVGSRMLAQEHIRRAGPSARYAIFYGPVGYVSQMRGGTFRREIESRTNYELVAEYYVGFDRARAREAARKLFEADRNLTFVYAASTDIAHGVTDALAELGMAGSVTVNGWGGGSSELESIRQGVLDFTVMRMNDDNGVAMAEAIRLALSEKKDLVPQVYSGSFRLIDQTTSDTALEALVNRAFRYSR